MSNSERVPDFLSTSFSFLVRFGGAKLHIFFSTTKYFLIFFKNIFSPLFPWNQFHAFPRNKFLVYILLHPQLLKKRDAKSTQPFCIFQMFWEKLLITSFNVKKSFVLKLSLFLNVNLRLVPVSSEIERELYYMNIIFNIKCQA